ncbi:hypothetical protein JYU34_017707 [Plutella xylostella]|uniref:Ionotropic receptor n=1 Tax=Plutella xylostella TaxID=51655 RepID=A0ABQ7Q1R2_PLUXY|nr:hypothetical protein JYU34_017707 [Plutella xylostella]
MIKILLLALLAQNAMCLDPSNALYSEVFAYHNETSYKAQFAYKVVSKLHRSFRQWFFTIIFCEFTYFENRIVKYAETLNNPVLLLNSCPATDRVKIKPKIDTHGETAYIVSSDEITPEINEFVIRALVRTGVWKPRSAVIFVINVPVEVDSYFYHTMKTHFQLLWSNRITNSVLVVWNEHLRLYTFNPYFDEVREVTYQKDITKLLAKQYNNLYGKELRLSVFKKIFVYDDPGPVKCNSRLTTTVMQFLNATCNPVAPRDGATVGALLDNGTATGSMLDLIDGFTEMELSSRILQNNYYGYIDTTYPLLQDELCFLVEKSSTQSNFMSTIKLLTPNALLGFAAIGIITSAITYPRSKPDINTLSDLAKSNLILAVHHRHISLFEASLSPNYQDLLLSPMEVFSDKQFKDAIDNRKFQYAMLMRKSDAQFISRKISNMKDGRPLFHTVLECPLPCFIVYGLEYGSPYLPILNNLLHHLNQAGILNYWTASEESVLYQTHSQILYAAGEVQGQKALNMENLREVFYVWLIGLFISVIGLISEIGYHALSVSHVRTR